MAEARGLQELTLPELDAATEAALAELDRKLDRAVGWIPQPGDRVAGRALSWETVTPRDDDEKRCEVLTLLTSRGLVGVWAYPKQLKTRLIHPEVDDQQEAEAVPSASRLARVGDLVAIEFVGKFPHPEKQGAEYGRYRVEISRPVAVPDRDGDGDIPFDGDVG